LELLIASGNPKKIVEIELYLKVAGVRVLSPFDVGGLPEVEEDGLTFAANAEKKAISAATVSGRWALADDSGLEVDHLGGAPGVHSARFAGTHGDDEANNLRLLKELEEVEDGDRGARFTCALALARPDGWIAARFEGTARGRILRERRGSRDFGYDPYFLFTEEGYPQTGHGFAELDPEEKSAVSHRGRALAALREYLMTAAQEA
jgi:XTP/dITP diphosphohydrolase